MQIFCHTQRGLVDPPINAGTGDTLSFRFIETIQVVVLHDGDPLEAHLLGDVGRPVIGASPAPQPQLVWGD